MKICNTELQILFDYCHEIKCVWTLLSSYNLLITIPDEEPLLISWSVLKLAYEHEKKRGRFLSAINHLHYSHIYKGKMKKIQVKSAAQVFSNKTTEFLDLVSLEAGKQFYSDDFIYNLQLKIIL